MDVAIDDSDLAHMTLFQHDARRHRDIVEDAEARPAFIAGMVAAARERDSGPVVERETGGQTGPADRSTGPRRDGGRHLEADTPRRLRIHR